jgi:two-component system chemotaxis response regulator CheY
MKVLLVDDSITMRRIQKTQLANLGIKNIIEAENGEEGFEQLRKNMPVDLILLDWNMPIMDGFTMLKKIRQDAVYSNVQIIMCTSESEKSKVFEALKCGANNYIIKPFTPQSLKEKLKL